jgi:hypothetical protein
VGYDGVTKCSVRDLNHGQKCSLRCAFLVYFKSRREHLLLTFVRRKMLDQGFELAETVAHSVRAGTRLLKSVPALSQIDHSLLLVGQFERNARSGI